MNDREYVRPADAEPAGITMLEGGKVLFDQSVGLQPVRLVEIPLGRSERVNHESANRRR